MKQIKFLTLMLVGLTLFTLTSCSKDEEEKDLRDNYVGTWNATTTGSLTFYQNGQSVGTAPLNQSNSVVISKSGSNILIIDGKSYTVIGNSLTSSPNPINDNFNGISIVGT